jgi:fido (protein-threonine AMPylation protein)
MKAKFTGTRPDLIESELSEAFAILVNDKYSYQEASVRFYAEFVAIHPFYDANGRIGRYIVDIYLRQYQHYVDWQSVKDSHKKFMRKLNYCHSVRTKYKQYLHNSSSTSYSKVEAIQEKYIIYLVRFWEQFVKSNDNLEYLGDL